MRPFLYQWWQRIRALWKWVVASVLLPLPLHALHEWLREWIASQSGWFGPIMRTIVNHPWFPWALLPIGVLVLVVKAYADTQTLTWGSQDSRASQTVHIVRTSGIEKPSAPRDFAGDIGVLIQRGSRLREEILGDEDLAHIGEWRSRIESWRQDVKQYLYDHVSQAKALYVDVIFDLPEGTILFRGKGLPGEKGHIIQDLEERLKRLGEMLKVI
jgi:hypothetical protein